MLFLIILAVLVAVVLCFFLYSSYKSSQDQPRSLLSSYTKESYVSIDKPGGFKELKLKSLTFPTKGADIQISEAYNYQNKLNPGYFVISVKAVGVNYADVCIRWGIYESAKKFVGFPITPGFEFSGTIQDSHESSKTFKKDDRVFGVTLFGGYSSRILVHESQIFHIPAEMTFSQAAGFPTMSLTAYYGFYELFKNRKEKILVHSAAGGVGGMLVQLARMEKCPVVGVVGSTEKKEYAKGLGCDLVIDKSKQDLWTEARKFAPEGFHAVFDANGVETLAKSFESLAPEGKLVVYGFHTMLPRCGTISAFNWLKVAWKLLITPKFSPLELTKVNKSVMAFNLSFLFNRKDVYREAMSNLLEWLKEGKIKMPKVTEYKFWEIAFAHFHLQSGKTMGKIVLVFE